MRILMPGSLLPFPFTLPRRGGRVLARVTLTNTLEKPFTDQTVHVVRSGNVWALTTESSRMAGDPPVAEWRSVEKMGRSSRDQMVRPGQFLVDYRPMEIVDAVYDSLDDVIQSIAMTMRLKVL